MLEGSLYFMNVSFLYTLYWSNYSRVRFGYTCIPFNTSVNTTKKGKGVSKTYTWVIGQFILLKDPDESISKYMWRKC